MFLKDRGAVVRLDRRRKASMISSFLEDAVAGPIEGYSILDVGCGNGMISEFFCERNSVSSTDIADQRLKKTGRYEFSLVENESLPFCDSQFDFVISHHVIEHVNDQPLHLSELRRVLKDGGIIYLGCPNKSSPFMAGHVGNKKVLRFRDMYQLFKQAGLIPEECYTRFLKYPDRYFCDVSFGRYIPEFFLTKLRYWYPSQCFLLRKM